MNRALGTGRLVLFKGALLKPALGIGKKVRAFEAFLLSRLMPVAAVNLNHRLEGASLSFKPGRETNHGGTIPCQTEPSVYSTWLSTTFSGTDPAPVSFSEGALTIRRGGVSEYAVTVFRPPGRILAALWNLTRASSFLLPGSVKTYSHPIVLVVRVPRFSRVTWYWNP